MKAMLIAFWLSIFPAVHTELPTAAPVKAPALSAESTGDSYYAVSNTITQTDKAVVNINLAIGSYEKALVAGGIKPSILVKYINACDFKYKNFTQAPLEKKKAYEALIKQYESPGSRFSKTREYNYVMALLWGRRGEITQNVMDNSNKAVAEKIKFYGEALYAADKKYEDYFACKILGRVHYLSPNIPFLLPWPDKNKSKAYLAEAVKGDPGNSEARMFLADTTWLLGDKKTALKLYRQVLNSSPRAGNWFYDTRAIKMCAARMKELNIK